MMSSGGGSQLSSGSDSTIDEKKRRRMISNRESARKSRMKKQTHVRELTTEIARFQRERNQISKAIDAKEERLGLLQAENDVLLADKAALTDYLKRIQGVQVNMYSWNFRHAGNEVQEPWQVRNPSHDQASNNVFRAQ